MSADPAAGGEIEVGASTAAVAIDGEVSEAFPAFGLVAGFLAQFADGGEGGVFAGFDVAADQREPHALHRVFSLTETEEVALRVHGHNVDKIGGDDPEPVGNFASVGQAQVVLLQTQPGGAVEDFAAGEQDPGVHGLSLRVPRRARAWVWAAVERASATEPAWVARGAGVFCRKGICAGRADDPATPRRGPRGSDRARRR